MFDMLFRGLGLDPADVFAKAKQVSDACQHLAQVQEQILRELQTQRRLIETITGHLGLTVPALDPEQAAIVDAEVAKHMAAHGGTLTAGDLFRLAEADASAPPVLEHSPA